MAPRSGRVDRSYLSRVRSIQGGAAPPSPARALRTLAGLERELSKKARAAAAVRRRADQLARQANAPLIEMFAQDKSARAAARRADAIGSRRRREDTLARPPRGLLPGVSSGSILTVLVPPYDYDWTWHWEEPGSHGDPTASRGDGKFGGHSDNVASCAFGVGTHFRPIAERATVRFSPLIRYGYYYVANSHFYTAYTSGFLGVYVSSVDANWGNPSTEIDMRLPIWEVNEFGNGPLITSEENNLILGGTTIYFPAIRDRHYFAWAWGGVSSWGFDDSRGRTTWSQAYSNLWATALLCVFEQ